MKTAEIIRLTKEFGKKKALNNISVQFDESSVIGLIGLNGSGKTTLLRHLTGVILPTSGQVLTYGKSTELLGSSEFNRIGVVHQENRFLEWMTVEQQIRYISGYYEKWDPSLEYKLVQDFKIDLKARVGTLSPGNVQKLAVLLAVCHQPEFLLLDEPASAMDPISRKKFLEMLFNLLENQFKTVIISSHVLTDIEKIVNHIICLDEGSIVADCPLDELYERFEEWVITSTEGRLPEQFLYSGIVDQEGDKYQKRLRFDLKKGQGIGRLSEQGFGMKREALNLEKIFPLLIGENES